MPSSAMERDEEEESKQESYRPCLGGCTGALLGGATLFIPWLVAQRYINNIENYTYQLSGEHDSLYSDIDTLKMLIIFSPIIQAVGLTLAVGLYNLSRCR